jgi:hypothetical protein
MKRVSLSVVTKEQSRAESLPLKISPSTIAFRQRLTYDPRGHQISIDPMEEDVKRPRAADDFAAIRARMEELDRERKRADAGERELRSDQPTRRTDRIDPAGPSLRRPRDPAG